MNEITVVPYMDAEVLLGSAFGLGSQFRKYGKNVMAYTSVHPRFGRMLAFDLNYWGSPEESMVAYAPVGDTQYDVAFGLLLPQIDAALGAIRVQDL